MTQGDAYPYAHTLLDTRYFPGDAYPYAHTLLDTRYLLSYWLVYQVETQMAFTIYFSGLL